MVAESWRYATIPPMTVERIDSDPPSRTSLRAFAGAAGLYLFLVAIATFPTVFVFGSRFVGDLEGDFWKHAWGQWWVHDSLTSGVLPLFCRLLNAPSGGYLFVADPFNGLAMSVLLEFLPLAPAYNLLVLANLWGGCMAAWALARHFVHDARASLVAGAVYGLSPYVLAYPVVSGVTETLNTAWIPLFVLFLHRTAEGERFSDLLLAGAFFFLTTFSCWYYGQFMVVYAAVLLGGLLVRRFLQRGPFRPRFRTWRQREALSRDVRLRAAEALDGCRSAFLRVGAALAVGACLVLPFATVFQMVVSDPANIVMPDKAPQRSLFRFQDFLGSNSPWSVNSRGIKGHHNHTNLAGFLLTGKSNATVTVTIDRLTRVHYLGYVALILAVIGWRRRADLSPRDRTHMRYWLATGLFFLALSLGPIVHLSDFTTAGFVSPLYLGMYWLFPMFHKVAIPFRFLCLALMALSVLAAFGARTLLAGRAWTAPGAVAAGLGVLVVLETAWMSPLPWPLPTSDARIPAFYEMAAAEPGHFGIIDYPPERPNSQLIPGEYFHYQTLHRRPIPYRTSGVLSPDVARNPMMEEVQANLSGVPSNSASRKRIAEGAARLSKMGFRYLVLHEHLLPPLRQAAIEDALTPALGPPARFADGVLVYPLGAPSAMVAP